MLAERREAKKKEEEEAAADAAVLKAAAEEAERLMKEIGPPPSDADVRAALGSGYDKFAALLASVKSGAVKEAVFDRMGGGVVGAAAVAAALADSRTLTQLDYDGAQSFLSLLSAERE